MPADLLSAIVAEAAPRLAVPPPKPIPPPGRRSLIQSLGPPGLRVIAEVKRRSPSAGLLRQPLLPGFLAASYQRGGAAAVSVVTEPAYFGGDARWVAEVKAACELPVLQKDFFSRPEQVAYGQACGADAILLIARILPGALLSEMLAACREVGVEALVETHERAEVERALEAGASLVGVNSRDLRTFQVDVPRACQLVQLVPPPTVGVLESGVKSPGQFGQLVRQGARCFLIGEYLLRQSDPEQALRELLEGPWSR